jgi:hypothetical protein
MQVIIEDHFLDEVANYIKIPGKSPYPDEVIKALKNSYFKLSRQRALPI